MNGYQPNLMNPQMGQFNPYANMPNFGGMNAYQRLQEMEAQRSAPMQQANQMDYSCRPVTSMDEVKAIPVDFSGKPMFFYNQAGGEMYVKQFDINTGAAQVKIYSLQAPEAPQIAPEQTRMESAADAPKYATMDDLSALEAKLMEGMKNDAKNVSNAGKSKPASKPNTANDTGDATAGSR